MSVGQDIFGLYSLLDIRNLLNIINLFFSRFVWLEHDVYSRTEISQNTDHLTCTLPSLDCIVIHYLLSKIYICDPNFFYLWEIAY